MMEKEKLAKLLEKCPYLDVLGGLSYWDEAAEYLLANGVRLEENQATSDKTSDENKRWISVSERLPEHCVTVLSYDGRHYRNVKTDSYDHCFECWLSDMDNVLGTNTVTHWMPLPEPPQEEHND